MPLTAKGEKIKAAMRKQYGAKKGEQVFYASQNKGTITGTHEVGTVENMKHEETESASEKKKEYGTGGKNYGSKTSSMGGMRGAEYRSHGKLHKLHHGKHA